MLAIVAAVVAGALGLAGVLFALTRNDDDSVTTDGTTPVETSAPADTEATESTEPSETTPAVTSPADSVPLVTTPPVTAPQVTAPQVTVAPVTTLVDTTPPSDSGLTSIDQLLAWTSFSEEPLVAAEQQAEIDALIELRFVEAVAHPTTVSTICAGIPVDAAMDLTIVWQYLGETVQTDDVAAAPPGVGSCIDNGGDPLGAGSYQVFAATPDLVDIGYATTFVVGASTVTQTFVNNSDQDLCDVGLGPLDTQFYEFFVSENGIIVPGDLLEIDVASVEQDLRATACDGTTLEPFTFFPDSFTDQNLSL